MVKFLLNKVDRFLINKFGYKQYEYTGPDAIINIECTDGNEYKKTVASQHTSIGADVVFCSAENEAIDIIKYDNKPVLTDCGAFLERCNITSYRIEKGEIKTINSGKIRKFSLSDFVLWAGALSIIFIFPAIIAAFLIEFGGFSDEAWLETYGIFSFLGAACCFPAVIISVIIGIPEYLQKIEDNNYSDNAPLSTIAYYCK